MKEITLERHTPSRSLLLFVPVGLRPSGATSWKKVFSNALSHVSQEMAVERGEMEPQLAIRKAGELILPGNIRRMHMQGHTAWHVPEHSFSIHGVEALQDFMNRVLNYIVYRHVPDTPQVRVTGRMRT